MLDEYGRVVDPGPDLAGLARREVDALKERKANVGELDKVDRALAINDLNHDGDPELRRLRRYETSLHTRLRWCLKQITIQSPYRCPDPSLRPQWVLTNEPERKPEPKHEDEIAAEGWTPEQFQPPFCLTEEEAPPLGQAADIPAILSSRREKRLRKAEALCESRRRKLDKLLRA